MACALDQFDCRVLNIEFDVVERLKYLFLFSHNVPQQF